MRLLAAAVALSLCGCSLAFVSEPRRPYVADQPCSSSRVAPAFDALWAVGAFGGAAALAATGGIDSHVAGQSREPMIITGFILTVIATGSAAYGFGAATSCDKAKAEAR